METWCVILYFCKAVTKGGGATESALVFRCRESSLTHLWMFDTLHHHNGVIIDACVGVGGVMSCAVSAVIKCKNIWNNFQCFSQRSLVLTSCFSQRKLKKGCVACSKNSLITAEKALDLLRSHSVCLCLSERRLKPHHCLYLRPGNCLSFRCSSASLTTFMRKPLKRQHKATRADLL